MNPAKDATEEAARAILDEVAPGGSLDLEAFSNIMSGKREFPDQKEELIEAFQTMGDKQKTGKIDEQKMRAILTAFGTTLTQDEVNDLVAKAGVDAAGRVEYQKWVETVYSS
jgi:Ca2+-binding EF-hand superfamily protein|eukprot:COSAG06_NODE_1355_length_9743_cov_3.335061_4_plen_112_part_00